MVYRPSDSRDIATHHPGAYRPSVAAMLNNLEIL